MHVASFFMYLSMYISNKVPVKQTATYIPIHPYIEEIFPSILIMKIYDTHTEPNLINKPTGSLKHTYRTKVSSICNLLAQISIYYQVQMFTLCKGIYISVKQLRKDSNFWWKHITHYHSGINGTKTCIVATTTNL